jgi:lysophospholipase L1-like esterase
VTAPVARTLRAAGVVTGRASHSRWLPALLLAPFIGLGATGCDSHPDAAPASRVRGRPIRIVALGDSTTEASWEGNAKTVYAERLAAGLEAQGVEVEMINAGLSDTTSLQAVARLDSDVRRYAPDYVIVQFGINDSWIDASQGRTTPRLTLDEYTASLETIIRTLRADGARPILMTPNPMRWSELYGAELRDPALGFDFDDLRGINRLLDVYAKRVREIARRENVPLVDVSAHFEAYGPVPGQSVDDLLIENDGIHPNDAGHALIAEWLLEALLAELTADRTESTRPAAGP